MSTDPGYASPETFTSPFAEPFADPSLEPVDEPSPERFASWSDRPPEQPSSEGPDPIALLGLASPFDESEAPPTAVDPAWSSEALATRVGDAGSWRHLWADWSPVVRKEDEAPPLVPPWVLTGPRDGSGLEHDEHQAALPPPTVTRTFPPQALAELPDVLKARAVVGFQTTVPTERILWMIAGARANRGAEPGWADRLLVDVADLPKAAPSTTVHVVVFQTVPFDLTSNDTVRAFHRFCTTAFPTKEPPFDALSVGRYTANRALEDQLLLPPGSVSAGAGLASQLTVDEAAKYKLVVYAVLPRTVGMVVAPRDQRSLRGFAFGKWTLTAEHEHVLDSLAREMVRSWYSRRVVTRVVAQGHTDPVGTRQYNYALGRRRAEAVTKRLKELVDIYAASVSFPAGVLDRIQYVVETYGEDRPFSRRLQSLNRRVEVTLHRQHTPPPAPLDLDVTITRQTTLLARGTLDADATKRLECVLQKVRRPGADDRYVTDMQVFLVKRDNAMPGPTEWNRVLSTLLDPQLFAPQVPDGQVLANLGRVDEDIAGGIVRMNQIIAYASGADWGLGLLALPSAFKQLNAWVIERLKDPSSIYSCYADLFL